MSDLKVAFIGAGGLANQAHYPSVAGLSDAAIVAICDLDEQRRQETARKFGVERTFGDYRQMLDTVRPDAVYALMPPHHLFDVAMDVLDAGVPLFVEKPPAVSTPQAHELGRRAEQQGVVTAVGFQRRYHPLAVACCEKVSAHGPIHQVVSSFYKNLAPAEVHPYYRGAIDILRSDAIHAVDSLRYFTGLSPVKAVASEVRDLDCKYAVSFNAIIHFENDVVGVLLANWRTGRRMLKMEFHGRGACAMMDADGDGAVWADNNEQPLWAATHREAAGTDAWHVHQGFEAESRAFLDGVRSGRQVHNSLPDAALTMALADRIYSCAINR